MSRDDWVAIIKKRTFKGYALSASILYPTWGDIEANGFLIFNVKKIADAISIFQDYNAEYGYTFLNKMYNCKEYRPLESKSSDEK